MNTPLLVLALLSFVSPQDPAAKRLVLDDPAMQTVEVRRNLPFYTRTDEELLFDVYRPPGMGSGEQRPVVLLMNASGPVLKDWRQYEDWGRLCAASGLIGVTFQARRNTATDFDDLLVNLTDQAEELGLDPDRIGVWACSANARTVTPWVMNAELEQVRCAVFYYGVMEFATVRDDLPVLVLRAGLDEEVINESIDGFVAEGLRINAPLTLINYAEGHHAFDVRDDTDATRGILRQTIEFLKEELRAR